MTEFTVFYSWQSDLPTPTNWTFIEDALKKACRNINNDTGLDVRLEIDRDTKNLRGAPMIPTAILAKIDMTLAVVADCTPCYDGPDNARSPNPNVLYELGYARARHGEDNMILVVNTNFGRIEDLPFDLEKRRAIGYQAAENEANRSEQKGALVRQLEGRLRQIIEAELARPPEQEATSAVEALLTAVNSNSPTRTARVREYWQSLKERLAALVPDWGSTQNKAELLMETIGTSLPLVSEFTRVAEAIASSADPECAQRLYDGFACILEEYEFKPGASEGQSETSFDFWRFLGHELFVTLFACLIQDSRWELAGDLLDHEFRWPYKAERGQSVVPFFFLSKLPELLLNHSGQTKRLSVQADLLKARHSERGNGLITFQLFMEADYYLHLRGLQYDHQFRNMNWWPWSLLYLKTCPDFIARAGSIKFADMLMKSLRFPGLDPQRFGVAILDDIRELRKVWQGCWDWPDGPEMGEVGTRL